MDIKKINAYFDKNKEQFYTKKHEQQKKNISINQNILMSKTDSKRP